MLPYDTNYLAGMSDAEKFEAIVHDARLRYGAKMKTKREWSWFWRTLTAIRKVIFFNPSADFMNDILTTIGPYIFFPADFYEEDADKYDCVNFLHELRHVRQYKRFGLGSAWLGLLPFLLFYCLLPFPTIFAWFRYRLERVAFLDEDWHSMAMDLRIYNDPENVAELLSRKRYGFAWIFRKRIARWYRREQAKIFQTAAEPVAPSTPLPAVSPSQRYVLQRNQKQRLQAAPPLLEIDLDLETPATVPKARILPRKPSRSPRK